MGVPEPEENPGMPEEGSEGFDPKADLEEFKAMAAEMNAYACADDFFKSSIFVTPIPYSSDESTHVLWINGTDNVLSYPELVSNFSKIAIFGLSDDFGAIITARPSKYPSSNEDVKAMEIMVGAEGKKFEFTLPVKPGTSYIEFCEKFGVAGNDTGKPEIY